MTKEEFLKRFKEENINLGEYIVQIKYPMRHLY